MTETEVFRKAPIVEALFDIRALLPESVTLDTLATFQERLAGKYPSKQVRSTWTAQLQVKAEGPVAKGSGGPIGYMFKSADGKQIVQARKDGYSFSRLSPYTHWAAFSEEALTLWGKFVALAKPDKVQRVALRYINRMELPLPVELKDYVLTAPEIAPQLPQQLLSFFLRLVVPDETSQALAIITETTEDHETSPNQLPLILDIDVYREGTFATEVSKLRPVFEQLRDLKNRVFFGSLTERAKELFR
jgi:uncharacterized protein (TIGR04255 family)